MLDKIIDYYNKQNVTLPKKEIEIISKLISYRTLEKKEFLYKRGESDTPGAYILKGCLRIFIEDKNNNEYNRFFAFEDWWVGEFHQIINSLPSKTSVQALEKTEIVEISKNAYDVIFSKCPVFTNNTLKFYLKSYAHILEREEMKKTMTIEELYSDLRTNFPEVIERVPLYHIASYLGVKAESLSRVKKKFKE
ncbi:Crp/Fnr family transcriptional regulator [Wenyingzhuangia sp. 2_MG-2023]|uniref:Crp/Fnr family transcriptional regulator n=1 Tax=Wenyingzhuangia sp. 2_MG-2023 TaxID=3062639 RepID=UPI0026E31881|nr:Crp/Fnr family transcriptional regulator [Wenyingzhuangia sp. 2_MG-2023]MDO6738123.1 Crp/Fnr family transcriptional regulator [Wenyingzhuangia sp. 2_MG-2023]MDO6801553.1 Crp/Fnr family transcriptional regulator [Wenyingzhuangia sp. 1_MG-2023]